MWLNEYFLFPLGLDYVDETLMSSIVHDDGISPGLTKNQKKHTRKRQKRKDEKETKVAFEIEEIIEGVTSLTTEDTPVETPPSFFPPLLDTSSSTSENVDTAKKVKNLRKKLKQIDELQRKLDSGMKLDPDQMKKLKKRNEILEELQLLTEQ